MPPSGAKGEIQAMPYQRRVPKTDSEILLLFSWILKEKRPDEMTKVVEDKKNDFKI